MLPLFSRIDKIYKKISFSLGLSRSKLLVFLLKFFTESARGFCWVVYVLCLNLLIFFNIQIISDKKNILKALVCPMFAWFFGKIIKVVFKRKRPFQVIENFTALTHSPMDDSFPSLHAASTSSFFVGLLLINHPYAIFVGIWSLVVIFSRLYLGVHYLSDLFGGILLGIFAGFLILLLPNSLSFF